MPSVVNWCPVAVLSCTPGSVGFATQAVGQVLLTHPCRSSRIDQELLTTGFALRDGEQPLCGVGWHSFTLIGLCQHPGDGRCSRSVRSWRHWGFQRCGVFPTLGALTTAILLHMCASLRKQYLVPCPITRTIALPLPCIEKSMGTTLPAAASACARQ